MRSTMSLSSPQNRSVWKRDPRMALYYNMKAEAAGAGQRVRDTGAAGGESDEMAVIWKLQAAVREDPSVLTQDAFVGQFAHCIGDALFSFMMKLAEELDVAEKLTNLGFDSLIAIKMRNWLRLRFAVEMSARDYGWWHYQGIGRAGSEEVGGSVVYTIMSINARWAL
jgi:hypothetical protein